MILIIMVHFYYKSKLMLILLVFSRFSFKINEIMYLLQQQNLETLDDQSETKTLNKSTFSNLNSFEK